MVNIGIFVLISILFLLRSKKSFIYYFFATYAILPDYFALELSQGLPLLKAGRILILLLMVIIIIREKRVYLIGERLRIVGMYWPFVSYFVCRILANLYYLTSIYEAINTEFVLVFEQLFLVLLLLQYVKTKEDVVKCAKALVYASGIVAVISIISVITGENLFYFLKTVNRDMLMASTTRMGIVRAEAGFGHPVYYGVYCALMIPLSYYLIELSQKKVFIVISGLNAIALMLTESRGSIAALGFLIVFSLFKMSQARRRRLLKGISIIIVIAILAIVLVPEVANQFSLIIQSMLAIFNADIAINNFGGNSSTGLSSRLIQFTGVIWTGMHNAIFGLGASCHTRGVLSYYKDEIGWFTVSTIDNGFVGYFVQEGILGICGFVLLFVGLIKKSWKFGNTQDKLNMNNAFLLCFIVYLVEMLSVADSSQALWLIIVLFIAYNSDKSINLQSNPQETQYSLNYIIHTQSTNTIEQNNWKQCIKVMDNNLIRELKDSQMENNIWM